MVRGMSVTDNFMNHIKQQVGTSVTSAYFWICVIAVVLVIERILSVVYRDKLRGTDSAGATIRNVGLIIADLTRNRGEGAGNTTLSNSPSEYLPAMTW